MSTPLKEGAPTPEKWKRPEEVMRLHKLRMKKKALQARMNRTEIPSSNILSNKPIDSITTYEKRKNPFSAPVNSVCNDSLKRVKSSIDDEASNDQTLFRLLNMSENAVTQQDNLNFENLFTKIRSQTEDKPQLVLKIGSKVPPIDWTLRTKLRFMAQKPFAWNQNLRTCEEASGITGFVRCLDTQPSDKSTLDTSPSARFHQCCLVWQHPVLPWLELFPRTGRAQKVIDTKITPLTGHPAIKESLQREWEESFRSLYQLLRARQCPYFYLLTHTFTCLFRAAGICGHITTHAFITPTTRGFRQVLKDEDIAFTMPLKSTDTSHKSVDDTGYDTLDTTQNSPTVLDNVDDAEEGEEAEEWLHSMGVEAAEIKRISATQDEVAINKEKKMDKSPESLVYIEGTEVQVLFNFLLNCKSCVATTGPLTGVPPTLLAPVAFHGATLKPLKIRESKVRVGTNNYYSMEVRGPILPTTVHNLCNLLSTSQEQFSFTFANLDSTKPLTSAGHATVCGPTMEEKEGSEITGSESNASCSENKISNSAFEEENLSDCGLPRAVLKCLVSKDAESVHLFDSLKFSESVYSWT